ncbi:MAG: hypothetical protein WCJ64_04540 [Rhodospirillaceae bacterium]
MSRLSIRLARLELGEDAELVLVPCRAVPARPWNPPAAALALTRSTAPAACC